MHPQSQTISISRYQMRSDDSLNSRSQSTVREGALIRVQGIDGNFGYGCLHPWVELGDLSLDALISQLKHGRYSRQVKCALQCASVDHTARVNGVNLFDRKGLEVPDSHATIVGGIEEVERAVANGYDTIKLKMGDDILANIALADSIHQAFPKLRVRIDFNGVLTKGALETMLSGLTKLREQIDFIEDPCLLHFMTDDYLDELKNRHGIKIAIDRGVSQYIGVECDYAVVKPAVDRAEPICETSLMAGRNVVVTSYMDHPLGQSYAAFIAGKLHSKYSGLISKRCGLMTHQLYQSTAFTEYLNNHSPIWKKPEGTGLGFDDLLINTEWTAI